MGTKTYSSPLELKADESGSFRATFARFNVVDRDRDVTEPGAFTNGQEVRIARWGHNWMDLPVGKGVIRADRERAWVDGQFFTDTAHGLDTYRTVKNLGALQEWSYGFDITEWSVGEFEGDEVRFLKKLNVFEVSPVMLGAGIGTGTDRIKSARDVARVFEALEAKEQDLKPWEIRESDGKFCCHNADTGRRVDCHDTREEAEAHIRALYANVEDSSDEGKASWTTAYVNNLPDSAFAIILPGGEKDGDGKTTPRSLRKLPHHNAEGAIDLPHLRNGLARAPQADMSDEQKARALAHLRRHAGAEGVGDDGKGGGDLETKDGRRLSAASLTRIQAAIATLMELVGEGSSADDDDGGKDAAGDIKADDTPAPALSLCEVVIRLTSDIDALLTRIKAAPEDEAVVAREAADALAFKLGDARRDLDAFVERAELLATASPREVFRHLEETLARHGRIRDGHEAGQGVA